MRADMISMAVEETGKMSKLPVGIQVYGLRDLIENTPDRFEQVMMQVKELGYDGAELAGLYGLEPEYIREVFDKAGLIPISAHVPFEELAADPEAAAETYKKIGTEYLAVPCLPKESRPNAPGYQEALKEMARIGKIMKENGITLLYHNHDFEFETLPDGEYAFDNIYAEVPEEFLKAEPDVCWIKAAGQSPQEYLRRYKGRSEIVHLKDFYKEGNPNLHNTEESGTEAGIFEFRPVGFGMQIWEPILDAVLESDAKWVVVEQDRHYDLDPLEAARRSREYLKILGW